MHDGTRLLPYPADGGTGIGLVLRDYLRHRPDSPLAASEEGIRRSTEPEFVIQPNLFNGRAGLLSYLGRLRQDGPDEQLDELIDRHRRLLALHLIPYQGRPAFPGEQLIRLSTDLGSGSAGVLLALGTVLAGTDGLPLTGTFGPARLLRPDRRP